ncbi:hypothetical protein ABIE26_003857 [Pedobacter africanus]|uniref:Uncharacterized protein n=1 Tax=Pedobacter africanus TaxID=151894 RepID=A0ACC6L1C6_9SPHI|nr:hypothetical protein [Pedobacter africanus]MDR6785159.1 hypothetical protein [Pedobacter africanus]
MVFNIRTIDFSRLLKKVEAIRLTKDQFTYQTYLNKFAGKNCELCELPLNPYGIYLKDKQAICIQCFNNYIIAEDYLNNLKTFEAKVSRTNKLTDAFFASLKADPQNIDLNLANTLFKGFSLSEIEQMIGLPKSFGSFDYGVEAGNWKFNNFMVEIWFKNQVCTEVVPI